MGIVFSGSGCCPMGHFCSACWRVRVAKGLAARRGDRRYSDLGIALRWDEKMVCAIHTTRMILIKTYVWGARAMICCMYALKRFSCYSYSLRASWIPSLLSRFISLFILLSSTPIQTATSPQHPSFLSLIEYC